MKHARYTLRAQAEAALEFIRARGHDHAEIAELKRRIENLGMSPKLAHIWLYRHNQILGSTPARAIHEGRSERVIEVASDFCQGRPSEPEREDLRRSLIDYETTERKPPGPPPPGPPEPPVPPSYRPVS